MRIKVGSRKPSGPKTTLILLLCLILVLAVGSPARADQDSTTGDEIQENNDRLSQVGDNIERIEAEKRKTEETLSKLRQEQSDMTAYIEALQGEIDGVMAEIRTMTDQKADCLLRIENTREQIERTSESLNEAQETEKGQKERMILRIRYMYETGDTEALEMLLNSDDLAQFLGRAEYISSISRYDREQLNLYAETVRLVSEEKEKLLAEEEELLTEREELNAWETELKAKEASLEVLAEAKAAELSELNSSIRESEDLIVDYDAELAGQEAELLAIQQEIERLEEQLRQEEEERKRQEEEEKRRQEEEQQKQANAAAGTNISAAGFLWPVSCSRITSYFGYRVDPLTGQSDGTLSNHKGIDIALAGGALEGAPVSASAGGKVIISRWSESAGNWIILYHGNSTYTVYMHLSARYVSEGDWVNQGACIGLVGNTGWSTGAHLHFEVRVGGFINSTYSVDPLNYVSPN